jgi:hypothetical protein
MGKKSTVRLPFPELLYPYSPVAKPMPPPPISNVCEGETVCVSFSCSLVPYILGLLEVYRYKDSFTGTDEEKTIAVGVMRQLMEVFGMACCGDDSSVVKLHRINPDTGQLEISTDDGVTWTTDPQSPYVMSTMPKPLSGADGEVKRCEAANNVIEHMKDLQAKYSSYIGVLNDIGELIAAILVEAAGMLFLPLLGSALLTLLLPLAAKVWDTATLLLGTSQSAYDLLFTEENWTLVRCILFCHCQDNGKFTQGGWQAVINQIKSDVTLPDARAGANMAQMIEFWTLVGLNNAAQIGSGEEGNCDDCGCGNACVSADWVVIGNVVEITSNTITIDAVFDAGYGANMIVYGSNTVGEFCCTMQLTEWLIGTPATGWVDCTGGSHSTNPQGEAVGEGQWNFGGNAGRIRITSNG